MLMLAGIFRVSGMIMSATIMLANFRNLSVITDEVGLTARAISNRRRMEGHEQTHDQKEKRR